MLEDLVDGYSIEYPSGLAWDVPSYTNSGSVHSFRVTGRDLREGNYFTMSIRITPDEEAEFARTVAEYKNSFGESRQVTFKEQNATSIGSPKETHYILKRDNSVWDIVHPLFSKPAEKEVAERILNSLRFLSSEEVVEYIAQRTTIEESKLRDETRKANLQSLQTVLREYFRVNGRYPVAKTEERIAKGKESLSFLYSQLQSLPSIYYGYVPGDPREDFYYTYLSSNGTSYMLTAQLEYGQESDCDRSLSQDICIYAVRP